MDKEEIDKTPDSPSNPSPSPTGSQKKKHKHRHKDKDKEKKTKKPKDPEADLITDEPEKTEKVDKPGKEKKSKKKNNIKSPTLEIKEDNSNLNRKESLQEERSRNRHFSGKDIETIRDEGEREKLEEIRAQEEEIARHASGTFDVTVLDLEDLMGKYKERGKECIDLQKLEFMGGPEGLMEKLKTDPIEGISSTDYRENDFGSNKVFVEPVPPFCAYVWEALEDLMIRILIIAAVVQIILGATLSDDPSKDWIDGVSIILAVVIVTCVGSITNWEKETKFHELNDLQNKGTKYKVFRNGQPMDIQSDDLLVGDLINIMVGDIVPADMMLIEGNGIKIDESSLTGESDTMKKEPYHKCKKALDKGNAPSPFILSGTDCVEGTGYAIIIAVGDHSQKGIIKRTVDNAQENNQTPLEQKLDSIAETIGWFGMAAGGLTLVALFIRFGINYVSDDKSYKTKNQLKELLTSYAGNFPNSSKIDKVTSTIETKLSDPKKAISNSVLDIVLLCVSIIVVAIPEGLPLAVTLSLAFSIKKLMDQNNLVRKMHACETMGGANFICTDKTGTLTKNEMNVFKVLTGNEELELQETLNEVHAGALNQKMETRKIREDHREYFQNEKYWELLKIAIALNIDGQIRTFDRPNIDGDLEECETKNKTDKAFIDFLYRFKSPISTERALHIPVPASMKQLPFDSKRKRMTTFVNSPNFNGAQFRLFTKGGAENVKNFCKYYIDSETGEKKVMDDAGLTRITEKIESFNRQMLRSLYICYKDITEAEFNEGDRPENKTDIRNLTFLAVFGIRDSLRNGVKEAVMKCKEASVNVIMVTGDNIITATAIAKDCNILGSEVNIESMNPADIEEDPDALNDPNKREEHLKRVLHYKPKAINGNTFFTLIGGLICDVCKLDSNICTCPKTEAEAEQIAKKNKEEKKPVKIDTIRKKDEFKQIVKNLKVMARSQPVHKYALVLGLREMDYVVAVTGDGTNDAPALSKSNVGFAMFAGTDIAKEASDIVIMDNNFSSLVVAIIYGRNIYDNIRKFLQFQLTVNFCACLLVFICACIGNETPLTTIQMLWINLIMDSLGSLALATEPPYEALLRREPTKKDESIINGKMWKHIGIQSLVQLILLLYLYLDAPKFIKEDNPIRLAETKIIKKCYGKLPGGMTDESKILYGTSPRWSASDSLIPGMNELTCGRYGNRQDMSVAFTEYSNANGASTHITMVFDVFVIYTLFNQINARVIDDSFNILVRITSNFFFPVITLSELALQIIIVEFGNSALNCVESGLTLYQWGLVIGFSAITFVLSIIIKLIPLDVCIDRLLNGQEKNNLISNEDDYGQNSCGESIHQNLNDDVKIYSSKHENQDNDNSIPDNRNDQYINMKKRGEEDIRTTTNNNLNTSGQMEYETKKKKKHRKNQKRNTLSRGGNSLRGKKKDIADYDYGNDNV